MPPQVPKIGHAYAAGDRQGRTRNNTREIAEYFCIPPDRLKLVLETLEVEEQPSIVLLQNTTCGAQISAVSFFSSVWSRSYARVGTPYGRVHRDFHYQCLFSAMAALVEVGCDRIQIENPMCDHRWRKDAYICLLEAVRNIQRCMNDRARVHLEHGRYDPHMVQSVERQIGNFDLQAHRPIGTNMHIFEGLNMRTVFLETAQVALRNR